MGGGDGAQGAGHSALATRSRSTADRRYRSSATATSASDQVRDMSVKFIGLVGFRRVVATEEGRTSVRRPLLEAFWPGRRMDAFDGSCPGAASFRAAGFPG